MDAAIADLEHALALTGPDHWRRAALQAQLTRVCERFQRTAALEQRWKKQTEESPRDVGAILQLVDFYERTLNTEQEQVWLEKLSALRPEDLEDKAKLARLTADFGQLDRAAALLDEALAAQPDNADLVFQRAEVEVRQNLLPAARERVEKLWPRASADETQRARVIAWLSNNRLFNAVEEHLKEAAKREENGRFNLANWYFTQNRSEDAKRILQELAHEDQPAPERAVRRNKIAAILREHDNLDEAITIQKKAAELWPRATEFRLALADLLLNAKRFDEAQSEAEQAFAANETEKERIAADEKLFQIFQKRGTRADPEAVAPRTPKERVNWLTRPRDPEPANARIQEFIEKLAQETAVHPVAEVFLRLARWESWQRKNSEALAAARRALLLEPESIEARELAVKAAVGSGQRAAAMENLRELGKLDPARKNQFARQIGQLAII